VAGEREGKRKRGEGKRRSLTQTHGSASAATCLYDNNNPSVNSCVCPCLDVGLGLLSIFMCFIVWRAYPFLELCPSHDGEHKHGLSC